MATKPSKNSSDPPAPKPKAVTAVFDPVGMVNVHVKTATGNYYDVKPREPFKIAADDVAWFFESWDWAFRQRLCLVEDYKPLLGYHDAKAGAVAKPEKKSTSKPKPEAKQEPEANQFAEPDEGVDPEKE